MSELGAAWGSESASDQVWPGGRPPTSSPSSQQQQQQQQNKKKNNNNSNKKDADTKSLPKKKTLASKELAAKLTAQEQQEKPVASRELPQREGQDGASSLLEPPEQEPEPEPEVEPDRLAGMEAGQIFNELVSRGVVDPEDKKNRPSEEQQREMLRACYDDEAGRAYAVRLAEVDLPARAYAESRSRLISRMMFRKAASEALKHGQNEAEIALTRPSGPPAYDEWAVGEDPDPVRVDTMARWAIPIRTKRRATGASSMRAMTPSDVKARRERVAAEAAKAMRLANGRKSVNQTSASSLGSQPGPRQRRAAAAAAAKSSSASRPPRRSTNSTRSAAWKPTHGKAGTGFEMQIGAGLCMQGLGMVRPSTAPDPSQLTACVPDRRLRNNKARRLRVSPNGLHRPATAPSSSVAVPTDDPPAGPATTLQPAGDGSRRGSSGSSLAEIMVIEEDGRGVISSIASPHTAHANSDYHHHSSAWLDGTELAAIDDISGKMDADLHRMKDTLTAQLATANENDLTVEQQKAIQQALAGLVALEHQLLGETAVEQDGARPVTSVGSPNMEKAQSVSHEEAQTPSLSGPAQHPRRRSVDENAKTKFEKHTDRLLEMTSASAGKAVRSHVLRDCDARIAVLEEERKDLKKRLSMVTRDSTHGRNEAEQLQQILAVKEQENKQLQQHKLVLESQVYDQGVVTTEQQELINAIKRRMDLEMAHAALMLEEAQAHAKRMAGDLVETKHNLGQARQQLAVAKNFAKQLENRTAAVTYKLRQAERRRLEAETALAQSQQHLNNQHRARPPSPTSHKVIDAVAEMGRRRLEHQLQVAQHTLEAQHQELQELKKLKKEWQQASSHEYAPDGTRLGQDVPDFEDTADHGHGEKGFFPAAPEQPQPPQEAQHVIPVRPSSAHPRLQRRTQSAEGAAAAKEEPANIHQESGLLSAEEASMAKDGSQLSISLGEKGAFKKAMKQQQPQQQQQQPQQQQPLRRASSYAPTSSISCEAQHGPPFINRGQLEGTGVGSPAQATASLLAY